MDTAIKSKLIETGGNIVEGLVRMAFTQPAKMKASPSTIYPAQMEALKKLGPHTVASLQDNGDAYVKAQGKLYLVTTAGNVFEQTDRLAAAPAVTKLGPVANAALPTSEETTTELKRRLGRELYRAELDLAGGLKIAGKPCDCLSNKHTLMIEAAAEELISQDPGNAVYQEIIGWIPRNQHKVTPEAITGGKYAAEYPHMANEFKVFRKRVMGSVGALEIPTGKITLDQAKKLAAAEAEKAVEKQWNSQSKM
jgi:hypothetical protein